jgi:hypothetical protein
VPAADTEVAALKDRQLGALGDTVPTTSTPPPSSG